MLVLTGVLAVLASDCFCVLTAVCPLFFLPEKCEGGNPAEADQLLPAVEEEVLQTPRKDPLLRQRLQGRKPSCLSGWSSAVS